MNVVLSHKPNSLDSCLVHEDPVLLAGYLRLRLGEQHLGEPKIGCCELLLLHQATSLFNLVTKVCNEKLLCNLVV